MDTNKYPKPSLPTTQQVLQDLSDPDLVNVIKFQELSDDEVLKAANNCYKDFTQLEHDIQRQNELNANLDSLHEKLNESINNMKKQKI